MAVDAAVVDQTEEKTEEQGEPFDPGAMPLGTFAAFPVSDEPEWLPFVEGQEAGEDTLTQEQTNAIDAMVKAVAQCQPTARRLEVQAAWRKELMDRGFHDLKPTDNYGWEISGSDSKSKFGPYGSSVVKGHYATNVIGAHNDILVSALTRDIPRTQVFPTKPGDGGCQTAADAGNKYKHFIAHDNDFAERMSEIARFFCTDGRSTGYMAPWADAQAWGFEDDTPEVVPETEGAADDAGAEPGDTEGEAEAPPVAAAPAKPKRPRIRSLLKVFGVLSDKCPIMAKDQRAMPWRQIADEWDIALTKSTFPWVADQITGGTMGIAEISLDRVARCTINLALQRTTGDSIMRDCTVMFTWLRPEMYMDDSCPKALRGWFWKTFPKGYLAIHAGNQLTLARNESMDECLVTMHSRSGNGQNRRSMTEAYVNPQLRLNNWVDLIDEFFRKTIPRVGLRSDVWNVDAMRSSSVRVGALEPFMLPPGEDVNQTVAQFPMPTHQPALPDFIRYFAGELAELLTGAMPTLSASSNDDPETLGQSRLQNGNAMGRLGESWRAMCGGAAKLTELGICWAKRVQPENAAVDSILPGEGRLSVKIADLQGGDIVCYPEGDANFPETWAEREARWTEIFAAAGTGNQFAIELMNDPRNAALFKQFMPEGTVIPGADAVEKQQGEFEVLLKGGPMPNPKKALLEAVLQKGASTIRQLQMQQEQQPDQPLPELEQAQQMMQQAQQMLQGMPDDVSSVPVRGDGSENDAVEALVCLGMINSPEGRRLSVSKKPEDVDAWKNLMLHWQEHDASAKQLAQKNQKPLVPKVSANVAVDKLAPGLQEKALAEMGLPVAPGDAQQPLEPHEVTRKTTGVNQAGAPTEETISMSGKNL
jgi:hypothetical protein